MLRICIHCMQHIQEEHDGHRYQDRVGLADNALPTFSERYFIH